jgi:hypothetical protein
MTAQINTMATKDENVGNSPEKTEQGLNLKIFDLARSMGTQEDLEFINKVVGGMCANGQELPAIELVFTP